METYFLKKEDISKFYDRIACEFQLYLPVRINPPLKIGCEYGFNLPADDYLLKKYSEVKKEEIALNDYRCLEPTKSFFTYIKEDLNESSCLKPPAICGVKNCDLFSLKIQDHVFLGGSEEDHLYKARRESALIIASDCSAFKETCFCAAFDIFPHATEGFDFNLSALNDGYLLDVGSPKARAITESIKNIFSPVTLGQISGRKDKRETLVKRLNEHIAKHQIPKKETLKEIVLSGYDLPIWQEQALTCVECGGCVFICDTCHCFLLTDTQEPECAKRLRVWDGCMFKNFSVVAGGANPLRMRSMRLRNRYLKKFDFFIDNIGLQGCCGCGRCVDVCPGGIDIRHILRKLYESHHTQ
jgi:formate hydrogenlyase subunit 6/NADH:ubiquinone oxidoreductase subunit I